MRKLASIQQIADVRPHENADRLDVVTVLGWQVVTERNQFKVGDPIIYCEIDSVLPDRPEFEFLHDRKFRIRTIRLRGQISQGIVFPLSILPNGIWVEVGDDVTELLGVTKYDPPEIAKAHLAGDVLGPRPVFVPKTDETRIQSAPQLINEMWGRDCYITTKLDGSSMSVYYNAFIDEPFGVCSRNLNLKEDDRNAFWKVARKYELREKFTKMQIPPRIVIQGELVGPGIQKNPLGLDDLDWFVFNVLNLETGKYAAWSQIREFCVDFGLKTVPLDDICKFEFDLPTLLSMADGEYQPSGKPREGIVVRPREPVFSPTLGYAPLSFKVISNEFLLKGKKG